MPPSSRPGLTPEALKASAAAAEAAAIDTGYCARARRHPRAAADFDYYYPPGIRHGHHEPSCGGRCLVYGGDNGLLWLTVVLVTLPCISYFAFVAPGFRAPQPGGAGGDVVGPLGVDGGGVGTLGARVAATAVPALLLAAAAYALLCAWLVEPGIYPRAGTAAAARCAARDAERAEGTEGTYGALGGTTGRGGASEEANGADAEQQDSGSGGGRSGRGGSLARPTLLVGGHVRGGAAPESVTLKYCRTCGRHAPPRCKHCRNADSCVQKFDHFCPWVNNAVGARNYRYFFAFVTLVVALALCVAGACATFVALKYRRDRPAAHGGGDDAFWPRLWAIVRHGEGLAAAVVGLFCVGMMFPLSGLWFYHIYLITHDETTNESIKRTFKVEGDGGEVAYRNPYTRGGACANCWFACCGPRPPSLVAMPRPHAREGASSGGWWCCGGGRGRLGSWAAGTALDSVLLQDDGNASALASPPPQQSVNLEAGEPVAGSKEAAPLLGP